MKTKVIAKTTGNMSVDVDKKRYKCSYCGNTNWLENWVRDKDTYRCAHCTEEIDYTKEEQWLGTK